MDSTDPLPKVTIMGIEVVWVPMNEPTAEFVCFGNWNMPAPLTLEAALALPAGPELDGIVSERVMGVPPLPDGTFWTLPEYSTDIAAAWEVVEKIGDELTLDTGSKSPSRAILWSSMTGAQATGFGETVPLAICRAALKAT